MVPAHSHRISRVLPYSGCYSRFSLVSCTGFLTLFDMLFQNISTTINLTLCCNSEPRLTEANRFGLFLFRSPLLKESLVYFLLLKVLRCFSSLRSPLLYYFTHTEITQHLPELCFHIRTSTDRWIFAPPRSLSQLITSFFGSWCLGIHPKLLVA